MSVNTVIPVVVAALVLLVGWQVIGTVTGPEMQAYVDKSAEWCEDRDGDLYNARVIGDHGGLHCELPNGTSVHMSDVIEINEPEVGT